MKRQGFIIVCIVIIVTVIFMQIDTKLFDNKKEMYTYIKNPLLCGFLSGCTYYFSVNKTSNPDNFIQEVKKNIQNKLPFYTKEISTVANDAIDANMQRIDDSEGVGFGIGTGIGINTGINTGAGISKWGESSYPKIKASQKLISQTDIDNVIYNQIPPGEIILTGDPTI
jgi:hypothetical protein